MHWSLRWRHGREGLAVHVAGGAAPAALPRGIFQQKKGVAGMSDHVVLHEVGPRDGLQNEQAIVPVAGKLALIAALAEAGLTNIEVGSFVSPRWVPQMANTDQLLSALIPREAVRYAVLVPNLRGWHAFCDARQVAGAFEIAVFISASEGFSQSNLNCSIDASIAALAPVVAAAADVGVPVRGYVSCVVECPFDGLVTPAQVADVVARLRALAPMQVSLGDTLGRARPDQVSQMLEAVTAVAPATELAGHFHDTGGRALANIDVALAAGLRHFDSAVGGLGGCPYAPGAPGNVATEAVVAHLHDLGFTTGVDLMKLRRAVTLAKEMR